MVPKFLTEERHLPFVGRENLGEERVWGKVKNSVLTSCKSLRHSSRDVEKVFV